MAQTQDSCCMSELDVSGYLTGSTMPKLTLEPGILTRLPSRTTRHRPHPGNAGRQDRTEPAHERDAGGDGAGAVQGLVRGFRPHPHQDRGPRSLPRTEIWDLFPDKLDEDGKPEGWEVFRLNQIAKHHTEVLSPAATPDTEFEHFSLPAFDAGRRPAIDKGLSIKSNKTLVPKRAVLLSKLNPEIPRVWLPEDPSQRQQIGSTEFLALVPSVIAGRALLFCLFSDDRFREMLQSMVTGTSKSHQRISPKSLYEREVIAGNIQLFARFEELAHYLLVKTLANRSEAWTLAQARDLLLPNLVSGEIRVG